MLQEREPLPHEGRLFLHFIRHGKQDDYMSTEAQLAKEGINQSHSFCDEFSNRLIENPKVLVSIIPSPRPRAKETAKCIHRKLLDANIKSQIFSYKSPQSFISPEGTLDNLKTNDLPNEQLFPAWMKTNPEGSKERLKQDSLKIIQKFSEMYWNSPPTKADMHILFITHETTIGPLVEHLDENWKAENNIQHLEDLEVEVTPKDRNIRFHFRGRTYVRTLPDIQ